MQVFDSFAWFEYFFGTQRGEKIKKIIDSGASITTSAVTLYEIKNKLMRENKKWKDCIDYVLKRSIVKNLSSEIALLAADLKHEKKLGASDAFIYATAVHCKAKLVTGDKQLQHLENVEFI